MISSLAPKRHDIDHRSGHSRKGIRWWPTRRFAGSARPFRRLPITSSGGRRLGPIPEAIKGFFVEEPADNPERDPRIAQENAQANFERLVTGVPKDIQDRESRVADSIARLPGSAIKKLRALYQEMAVISEAIAPYVACKRGCTACCHYTVHLYPIEAELIEKRTQHQRLARPGAEEGFHGTPCPFLSGGQCGIYVDRPMSCRKHVALTHTAHWCDPARSRTVQLPMAKFSMVQAAFQQIIEKDGRTDYLDIRQAFGLEPRFPKPPPSSLV